MLKIAENRDYMMEYILGMGVLGLAFVFGVIIGNKLLPFANTKRIEAELKYYKGREMAWRGGLGNVAIAEKKKQMAEFYQKLSDIWQNKDLSADEKKSQSIGLAISNPAMQDKITKVLDSISRFDFGGQNEERGEEQEPEEESS